MSLNRLVQYRAGFLEEAAASGLAFLNAPEDNPIASIKLCGPNTVIANAYMANISVTDDISAAIKFKCDILSKDGNVIISHDDFDQNANENIISGTSIVHGVVFSSNTDGCYLTYSVQIQTSYSTLPAGAKNSQVFYLSPFALEPYVGDISAFRIKTSEAVAEQIDVSPLSSGNSRFINFVEGYNYELSSNSSFEVPRLNVGAIAGAGLGKEPCDDVTGNAANYLATINELGPNDAGDITINSTNNCLAIEPIKAETPGVQLSSHCAPCCRCADYNKAGKFLRSYAALYAKMAKEYERLVKLYNQTVIKFNGQSNCCNTHDKMNARFKVWPQQNFMVQVQALMENNHQNAICLCDVGLTVEVSTNSGDAIKAVETISTDPLVTVEHKIDANTPLIISPMAEASYVYFKNVNPGNQVQVSSPKRGAIFVGANVQGDLPVATPCDGTTNSLPANCMESCDGYLMLTAGFVITDPVFRKIVHLKEQEAANANPPQFFDGVELPLVIKFQYRGSPPDNPCLNPCNQAPITLPAVNGTDGVRRLIKIAPNRKSVNPCAPIRLHSITAETDEQGTKYYANFPENTAISAVSGASLVVKRSAYIESTQQWQTITPDLTVPISAGNEINRILLQNGNDNPLTGAPNGAVGISFTVVTTGQNMTSKCYPDPNDPTGEDINIAPSSVTYSVRL